MTCPGSATSNAAVEEEGGLGGAQVADGGREVRHQPIADGQLLGQRGVGAGVRAGDRDAVDLVGHQPGRLQGIVPSRLPERHVAGLPEALLPDLGAVVARRSPAVEELRGGPAAAGELGDHRAVASVTDDERGGTVAEGGLVGPSGQPRSQVGAHHEVGAPTAQRGVERPHRRAHRTVGVERADVGTEPQRGVDGGGVGLVGVGGRHRGEPDRVRRHTVERPERGPCRLDAHRGGVLVVARDGAGALAPAASGHRGDGAAIEPAVRQVRGRADDPASSHAVRLRRDLTGRHIAVGFAPGVTNGVAAAQRCPGRSPTSLAARSVRHRGHHARSLRLDVANARRGRRRKAARRRARAGPGADAGPPLRHPAARAPRCRRGEGGEPARRRPRTRLAAGDGRPRGTQRRSDLPAQQPRQALHRDRPQGAGRARPRAAPGAAAST